MESKGSERKADIYAESEIREEEFRAQRGLNRGSQRGRDEKMTMFSLCLT